VTTLRGRPSRFGAGVIVSALVALGATNVISPDIVIARVNVARSANGGGALDAYYLSMLSGEAANITIPSILSAPPAAPPISTPTAAHDYVVTRCTMFRSLLGRWGSQSTTRAQRKELAAWRTWNAGKVRALRVTAQYQSQLDAQARDACATAEATKPATQR
jgi:hypothetical protein